MELAKEVQGFSSACEQLLETIARHRRLEKDERRLIEYYCKEIVGPLRTISKSRPTQQPLTATIVFYAVITNNGHVYLRNPFEGLSENAEPPTLMPWGSASSTTITSSSPTPSWWKALGNGSSGFAIFRKVNGVLRMEPFSVPHLYNTAQEADIHGIAYGQRIIDEKIPGLNAG